MSCNCAACATPATPKCGASPCSPTAANATRTTSCPPDPRSAPPSRPWIAPAASTSATRRGHDRTPDEPPKDQRGAALAAGDGGADEVGDLFGVRQHDQVRGLDLDRGHPGALVPEPLDVGVDGVVVDRDRCPGG